MKNNDQNKFYFTFEDDNSNSKDISSSSKEPEFEEIYSMSEFSRKGKYRKRKRGFAKWWSSLKKRYKALIISGISLLLVICIALPFVYPFFQINHEELDIEIPPINEDIINVALFGIDTRDTNSFEGNSDSIMILSLNTVTKKVKIISIMRDTLVPIKHNGETIYTKINSAYSRGGAKLAVETINNIFGLDISRHATVNFFGMIDIIDAVGGIDVELTEAEVQPKSQYRFGLNGCIAEICAKTGARAKTNYIFTPGKHHLNGIQAVAYSRIRKVSNVWGTTDDYGRTDRQRYVMEQLFNKATKLEKTKYYGLAKSLIPCSKTSLGLDEIVSLAFNVLLDSPTFEQMRVPMHEYIMPSPNTPAGSVVYFDLDYAAKLVHAFIYNDIKPEDYIATNGVEKNDWYRDRVGIYSPSTSIPQETTSSDEQISSEPDTSDPTTSEGDESTPSESDPTDPTISDPSVSDPTISDPNVSDPTISDPNVSTPPSTEPTTPPHVGGGNSSDVTVTPVP